MENKKVSVLDDPEKIDIIIKSRLSTFNRKGGSNTKPDWPEEELELIDAVVLNYICEKGLSRYKTAQEIAARWEISMSTARRYVQNAINRFSEGFDDTDKEKLRKTFVERLEKILQAAINDNTKDAALKALDLYGKTFGFFKDKQDINLTGDNTIHFDFQ